MLRRVIGSALAATALAASVVGTAAADAFGTGGADTGWLADSRVHTYCHGIGTTGPTREDIVDYAMRTLASTTVMSRSFQSACTLNTDAIWQFGTIAPNVRGRYNCLDRTGNVCNRATLKIDPALTGNMVNHRKTACHELGHSVGLTHRSADFYQCMTNGAAPSDHITYRRYRAHHVDHINGHY